MKICAISDIHYPYNKFNLDSSIELMRNSDVLVIAGDISHNLMDYKKVLGKFNRLKILKLIVLGNHDIYCQKIDDSFRKIESLEEICKQNKFHLLDKSPLIKDDIGFIGNIGWYDYQFAQLESDLEIVVLKDGKSKRIKINEMNEEDLSAKNYIIPSLSDSSIIWNDIRYINWRFDDKEFLNLQLENLRRDLEEISPKVKKIVYVSHHIPIKEFVYKKENDKIWGVFNAYQGSPELGRIVFSDPKLRLLICGHSHIPDHIKIGNIDCYNVSTEFNQLKPVIVNI